MKIDILNNISFDVQEIIIKGNTSSSSSNNYNRNITSKNYQNKQNSNKNYQSFNQNNQNTFQNQNQNYKNKNSQSQNNKTTTNNQNENQMSDIDRLTQEFAKEEKDFHLLIKRKLSSSDSEDSSNEEESLSKRKKKIKEQNNNKGKKRGRKPILKNHTIIDPSIIENSTISSAKKINKEIRNKKRLSPDVQYDLEEEQIVKNKKNLNDILNAIHMIKDHKEYNLFEDLNNTKANISYVQLLALSPSLRKLCMKGLKINPEDINLVNTKDNQENENFPEPVNVKTINKSYVTAVQGKVDENDAKVLIDTGSDTTYFKLANNDPCYYLILRRKVQKEYGLYLGPDDDLFIRKNNTDLCIAKAIPGQNYERKILKISLIDDINLKVEYNKLELLLNSYKDVLVDSIDKVQIADVEPHSINTDFVEMLGHILSKDGIKPMPDNKVLALRKGSEKDSVRRIFPTVGSMRTMARRPLPVYGDDAAILNKQERYSKYKN
ncbi:hypothetical protein PIROE2DRAFT_14842 [Piromyces sp. E2]|nr:hypothetical protein PIROE2DRAFT_14842 [Piromyces sp. E2]|eukprot:OUM59572.1 hypothetical protein PIROE2DRAFT_14842 [Piromyces sp. E2]